MDIALNALETLPPGAASYGTPDTTLSDAMPDAASSDDAATVRWLEGALPRIMRRLMDSENLELPLLQLPLAQLRLAQALYRDPEDPEADAGETMGRLSERLGVRQNALTQAADRLISHGLAERLSDARDRRVVRLRLTATGCEWVGIRRKRRLAHLNRLWTLLEPQERDEFLRAVKLLEAVGARLDPSAPQAGGAASAATATTTEEVLSRLVIPTLPE